MLEMPFTGIIMIIPDWYLVYDYSISLSLQNLNCSILSNVKGVKRKPYVFFWVVSCWILNCLMYTSHFFDLDIWPICGWVGVSLVSLTHIFLSYYFQSFIDWRLAALTGSFFKQSIFKQLLTEGIKFL